MPRHASGNAHVRACMRACGDARAGWGAAACSERRSSKSSDSGGGLPKQHNYCADGWMDGYMQPLAGLPLAE